MTNHAKVSDNLVTEAIRTYNALRTQAGKTNTPEDWKAASQAAAEVLTGVALRPGKSRRLGAFSEAEAYLIALRYCDQMADRADKLENVS